jgi:hypothetical protein
MKSFKTVCLVFLSLSVCLVVGAPAVADIICDATLTSIDQAGNEYSSPLNIYVKSNKIKMQWQDDSASFVLRSDLQTILNIFPVESTYREVGFGQIYTLPFGPMPLTISPGFSDPFVEFIDTGEAELIDGLSCRKYVITEISSFKLLQYTIYATDELNFDETFNSFFSSEGPIKYQPFEEMRNIPGLPLKISISETVGDSTYVQTYEFFNYLESSLDDSLFSVPEGYTLQ